MKKHIIYLLIPLALVGTQCSSKKPFDAMGTFESTETLLSSEVAGKVIRCKAEEGAEIKQGDLLIQIDTVPLMLQLEQVKASIFALQQKTIDPKPQLQLLDDQLASQQTQKKTLEREIERVKKLLEKDAATTKQLDDLQSQFDVLVNQMTITQQQKAVQEEVISTQNRAILSEKNPLGKRTQQLYDQIQRAKILSPIKGVVLTKYVEENEVVMPGKALLKIASLDEMILRVYVTNSQLASIQLGQKVKVFIDKDKNEYKEYAGTISWISTKAEFTPKTIQTKEERANLVYAVKIKVVNDGYIKIGMYGEIQL